MLHSTDSLAVPLARNRACDGHAMIRVMSLLVAVCLLRVSRVGDNRAPVIHEILADDSWHVRSRPIASTLHRPSYRGSSPPGRLTRARIRNHADSMRVMTYPDTQPLRSVSSDKHILAHSQTLARISNLAVCRNLLLTGPPYITWTSHFRCSRVDPPLLTPSFVLYLPYVYKYT
jgi:hypothetical protein